MFNIVSEDIYMSTLYFSEISMNDVSVEFPVVIPVHSHSGDANLEQVC